MNTTTTVDLCCTKQDNEDRMLLLQSITVSFLFFAIAFPIVFWTQQSKNLAEIEKKKIKKIPKTKLL